jgi:glucose/arabinose dehydrogenase
MKGLTMGFRIFLALTLMLALFGRADALTRELIGEGLDFPTCVAFAPGDDSRAYVTSQWTGRIHIVENGEFDPVNPFLDVQSLLIGAATEGGLLSIAFDPDFQESRQFYICYVSRDSNVVVARYRVSDDPNFADSNSAEIVFDIEHGGRQHFAGNIMFGPTDGYLYISVGDGGIPPTWNASQNPLSYRGKILRIDVSGDTGYEVPPTNPFVGNEEFLPEIFAWGLRNPWRFSLDRLTGDMFIGDVGQSELEEIDYLPVESGGGQNFGWHVWEGTDCFLDSCWTDGFTFPIYEYGHDPFFGGAVTGGYVYRGTALPELQGHYVFADYVNAQVSSFLYQNEVLSDFRDLSPFLDTQGPDSLWFISSFGQDNHNELYLLDYVHQSGASRLYKIVPDDYEDCNANGVYDRTDILDGTSTDLNQDGVPDECQTPAGDHPELPGEIELLPNYPNPFNPSTTIGFVLAKESTVKISVYDISGRLVSEIANGTYPAGSHGVQFHAEHLASGVYFAVLKSGETQLRQKMMLLK